MRKLEASALAVRRNGKTLLRDTDFTLRAGDWLAVVGPNGAGKSTLMKALAGEWSYTGSLTLDGRPLKAMKPRERARLLGLMDQGAFSQFSFTVEEVVRMGRYPYRRGILNAGDPEEDEAVEQALEDTGLTRLRHRSILTLSGGEQQRCALAQALCHQPQVLMLDEPANHLDLNYQKELYAITDRWRQRPGHAVITVLHDLSAARCFATHALVLCGGRPLACGEAGQALSDDILSVTWQMDVAGWMRRMGETWMHPDGNEFLKN